MGVFATFSLYVGSISDVELARVSGLKEIEGKDGISVMADRGFTIKDLLKEILHFLRGDRNYQLIK